MTRLGQIVIACLVSAAALAGQSYTLRQAVTEAVDRYPATKVAAEQASAAAASVSVARTAFLPRLDFTGQANRATRNNVFGMLMPPAAIPGISGPVLGTNGLESVWGSVVGLQMAWEPFDFGLRSANVGVAEASRRRAETVAARARFEVGAATAEAFLTTLAAQQAAVAAEAGVRRSRIFLDTVEALVRAQLRPGADASRARAELALAEMKLVQSRQAIEVAKATLAQYTGADPARISLQQERLLELPPPGDSQSAASARHPALIEQEAAVEQARAADRVLERSYFPKFTLLAASYARGTGAMPDGRTLGGLSGLGPNIHNWGLGLNVTFPLLDLPAIRARREVEEHRARAEVARYDQIRQDLNAAARRARVELEGARQIALHTPVQLEAARDAERQALARYKAGLGTLVEVAEAQRLVTQAEIEDSLARLNVWRALLRLAAAEGDLEPFLRQVSR